MSALKIEWTLGLVLLFPKELKPLLAFNTFKNSLSRKYILIKVVLQFNSEASHSVLGVYLQTRGQF